MPDLSVPTRLAAFGAALALAFGGALAVGATVDPTDEPPRSGGHATAAEGPAHGGAATPDRGHGAATSDAAAHGPSAAGGHAVASAPGGLASAEDGYRLVPGRIRATAGRPGVLRFRIEGPDGRTVRSGYEPESERELHLIVVRRDGTGFQHLHPRRAEDGTWSTPLTLASGGSHRVLADFVHGGTRRTLGVDVEVSGAYRPAPPAVPARTAAVGGYRVTLDGAPRAGRESTLRFRVTRDGRPVAGLQPYLGARGHLVALREGDLAYLHVHPTAGEGEPAGSHDDAGGAPQGHADSASDGAVGFAATFPASGRHRLFLQFRTDGVVRTAPFVLEVAR